MVLKKFRNQQKISYIRINMESISTTSTHKRNNNLSIKYYIKNSRINRDHDKCVLVN